VAVGLGEGSVVGDAGRAVGFTVGFTVGFAVTFTVGLTVGPPVGLGVAVGLAIGAWQAAVGRPSPMVGWTAAAYGTRISAAGTWLVVKALGAMPG